MQPAVTDPVLRFPFWFSVSSSVIPVNSLFFFFLCCKIGLFLPAQGFVFAKKAGYRGITGVYRANKVVKKIGMRYNKQGFE